MSGQFRIFYGAVVNPVSLHEYHLMPHCLLAVLGNGNIAWIIGHVEPHDLQNTLAAKSCPSEDIILLKHGEFLIPGFIDTHTHAPQFPNIGSGQQYELMDWLEQVTFPMEAKFADLDFAQRTYNSVVQRLLDCGTTTCCYYGSLHLEASKVLADIVISKGQRAFVGKCNMNRDSPPTYIEPSTEHSIQTTLELISYIRNLPKAPTTDAASGTNEPFIQPILTPRFAISCTNDLLHAVGGIAKSDDSLRIQTHISENKKEIEYTLELFPEAKNYADVYDRFNLLTPRTVLGHAVHLSDDEAHLIKSRGSGISHCPTSNFNLRSGVAPVGKYLDMGIKVGLGTDVSGGYSPSILNVIQNASIASKIVAMQAPPLDTPLPRIFENRQLPISALLYLATIGGAEVCGLHPHVGSFVQDASFDALLVSTRPETGASGVWSTDANASSPGLNEKKEDLAGMVERFLFGGDDRNIRRVYVQGRVVGGKESR